MAVFASNATVAVFASNANVAVSANKARVAVSANNERVAVLAYPTVNVSGTDHCGVFVPELKVSILPFAPFARYVVAPTPD